MLPNHCGRGQGFPNATAATLTAPASRRPRTLRRLGDKIPPMPRRLRIALSLCSIALAVFFLIWQFVSLRYVDLVRIVSLRDRTYGVASRDGCVLFVRYPTSIARNERTRWRHVRPGPSQLPGKNFFGFRWYDDGAWRWLGVPLWLAALLMLLLAWMLWQRRPPPRGHCRQCGYDIRASPDRCPECGAATNDAAHVV